MALTEDIAEHDRLRGRLGNFLARHCSAAWSRESPCLALRTVMEKAHPTGVSEKTMIVSHTWGQRGAWSWSGEEPPSETRTSMSGESAGRNQMSGCSRLRAPLSVQNAGSALLAGAWPWKPPVQESSLWSIAAPPSLGEKCPGPYPGATFHTGDRACIKENTIPSPTFTHTRSTPNIHNQPFHAASVLMPWSPWKRITE